MNFLSVGDLTQEELMLLIDKGIEIKRNPEKYKNAFSGKTLLAIFEAPSLRTRLSFEVAAFQMGGQSIYYTTGESTLGKKESMKEFAKCSSRFTNMIAARLFSHDDILELTKFSDVPVINAMTNYEHPCQILGDLMTIKEKLGSFKDKKLAYLGDGLNNVTHSLMFGCTLAGMNISVATPKSRDYEPMKEVKKKAEKFAAGSGCALELTNNPEKAAEGADIVYTDSWMSYRIPKNKEKARMKIFKPFQVNEKLMNLTNNAYFMHCLPAKRGHEVTDGVIDSKQSIIFDQAENRLHIQKAIMLWLNRN